MGMHNPFPYGKLGDLQRANWSHYLKDKDGNRIEEMNDLDCIILDMILEEIREDGDISSVAYLMDFEINASTMKAKFYGNTEEFDIVKSKMNNRCRCHHSTKGYGEAFNISKIIK